MVALIGYVLLTAAALLCGYWLGIFTGAHYLPTSSERTRRMLERAELLSGERMLDIGSGDGRLVIAAAALGSEAHGYEINPFLVALARARIRRAGLSGKARIHWKNFWHHDLSAFDVVTVYGIPHIMGALQKKLQRELSSGSRVVSNSYAFPSWEGEHAEGIGLYRVT